MDSHNARVQPVRLRRNSASRSSDFEDEAIDISDQDGERKPELADDDEANDGKSSSRKRRRTSSFTAPLPENGHEAHDDPPTTRTGTIVVDDMDHGKHSDDINDLDSEIGTQQDGILINTPIARASSSCQAASLLSSAASLPPQPPAAAPAPAPSVQPPHKLQAFQAPAMVATTNTIQLFIRVPCEPQRLLTINLDPSQLRDGQILQPLRPRSDVLSGAGWMLLNGTFTSPSTPGKVSGFLKLPTEVLEKIFRPFFVSDHPLNTGQPENFERSGGSLRICRQVYKACRNVLYSNNTFVIQRRIHRFGHIWRSDWDELGFLPARRFIESIGPANAAEMRHLEIRLNDAKIARNPSMRNWNDRRFVTDKNVLWILEHLRHHAQNLKTLKLSLWGHRKVTDADTEFLQSLKRIKADSVQFVGSNRMDPSVYQGILISCMRRTGVSIPKATFGEGGRMTVVGS